MSTNRYLARSAAISAAVGLVTLIGAGTASAHVTADPEQAEQGGYAKVAFKVPNERPEAGTVKVRVDLPAEYPLTSVSTKPTIGWTAEVEKVKLDRPIDVEGTQITEVARSVTWTAQPGTRIGPDEFNEFEVSLGTLPSTTDQLVFATEQTYDNGEVVRWDAPPPAEGGEEPEHPAPSLTLVKGSESGHSHGAGASGSHDMPAASAHGGTEDNTARWLGGAGLVLGALGLGLGGGALIRARKAHS